jgi:hypothetical protein
MRSIGQRMQLCSWMQLVPSAAAVAEGELAALEVAEELFPFGVGRGAVFGAGPQGAAASDERAVPVDDFLGVDGLVSHGGVDVAVPGTSWAMCGGMPCMIASVISRRRKSWGANRSGWPLASVRPDWSRAMLSSSRIAWAVMGRSSERSRRWNSSGIGGFQTFSLSS